MTAALIATAFALLLWPRPIANAARIRRLNTDRRLMPVPPRAGGLLRASTDFDAAAVLTRLAALVVPGLLIGTVAAVSPAQGAVPGAEFGFCVVVIAGSVLVMVRRTVDGRGRANRDASVSVALALLVGEVEAGTSPPAALRAAGVVGTEIEARVRAGPSEASGLIEADRPSGSIGRRRRDDPLDRVDFAWRLSASTGVPLAEALGRVRTDLADRAATRREVTALIAGPQASATILALLPVLGLVLGSAIGADPIGVLFGTPIGRALLCVGVVLDAAGLFWTMQLSARVLR